MFDKKRAPRFALFLVSLFLMAGEAFSAPPAFTLTPEGSAFLREHGSEGYLYWGYYREC